MRSPFRASPPLRLWRSSQRWRSGVLSNWRGDLAGGITTAVVALPLAMAFGVTSGAGAIAGLWGAIVLGCSGVPWSGVTREEQPRRSRG